MRISDWSSDVCSSDLITVLSGFGTSGALFGEKVARFGWQYRTQPRRILTFVLDGKAGPLPPAAPDHPEPVADPEYRPDPALAEKGAPIYGRRCLVCHGVDRSEEHTSELQSLMRISYDVFCLKKK